MQSKYYTKFTSSPSILEKPAMIAGIGPYFECELHEMLEQNIYRAN